MRQQVHISPALIQQRLLHRLDIRRRIVVLRAADTRCQTQERVRLQLTLLRSAVHCRSVRHSQRLHKRVQ
jgi:hypothetical protein|eukprot:COSAG02_NODE_1451_length_12556_cov_3.624258_6_plen_70_part_00